MKVKVLKPVKKSRDGAKFVGFSTFHKIGEVIELKDNEANELLKLGYVSVVKEKESVQDGFIEEKPVEKLKPGRKKIDDVSK